MNRYSRQISLPEIGKDGQKKLQEARVLIVGVGGLGSPGSESSCIWGEIVFKSWLTVAGFSNIERGRVCLNMPLRVTTSNVPFSYIVITSKALSVIFIREFVI